MKPWLRNTVFQIIRLCGVAWIWRVVFQKDRVTILCYHDPAPDTLASHIVLLRRHYTMLPLRKYLAWRRDGCVGRLPHGSLVITLDDGHMGNAGLLDLAKEEGVPLTIFLCSGIVGTQRHYWWETVSTEAERWHLKGLSDSERLLVLNQYGFQEETSFPNRQALSHEEVQSMAVYVDFQAHTRFHPILPKCTAARARDEIAGCKDDLSRDYGLDIYALAYPNGDYCDRDVTLVEQAGYACALTIDEGLNDAHTDLYRLKRIIIPDDAGIDELIVKASGFWAVLKRLFRCRPAYGYHESNKG